LGSLDVLYCLIDARLVYDSEFSTACVKDASRGDELVSEGNWSMSEGIACL